MSHDTSRHVTPLKCHVTRVSQDGTMSHDVPSGPGYRSGAHPRGAQPSGAHAPEGSPLRSTRPRVAQPRVILFGAHPRGALLALWPIIKGAPPEHTQGVPSPGHDTLVSRDMSVSHVRSKVDHLIKVVLRKEYFSISNHFLVSSEFTKNESPQYSKCLCDRNCGLSPASQFLILAERNRDPSQPGSSF